MKPTPITPHLSRTVLALTLALATPFCLSATAAFAQAHGGGGGGSHSSGGGGGHSSSGGGHTSGGGSHSSGASGSHASSAGTARASATPTKSTATTASTGERTNAAAAPQSGRPRNGRPSEGTAVPRTEGRAAGTTGVGVGYTGFYPIGVGLGYGGYYGGYYDPGYGGYDPYGGTDPYYVPPPPSHHDGDGAIRLKITPKQALVYVDGYFAGVVDDFDGIFQKLHLEAGPHHIDVQAEGYESLAFDVQITPDHTLVYEAELHKIQ